MQPARVAAAEDRGVTPDTQKYTFSRVRRQAAGAIAAEGPHELISPSRLDAAWAVRSLESAFSAANQRRGVHSAFSQWGGWEALPNLNEECIFRRHFRVSSDCLSSWGERMLRT